MYMNIRKMYMRKIKNYQKDHKLHAQIIICDMLRCLYALYRTNTAYGKMPEAQTLDVG